MGTSHVMLEVIPDEEGVAERKDELRREFAKKLGVLTESLIWDGATLTLNGTVVVECPDIVCGKARSHKFERRY